jgi:hypothetical protein
VRWLFFSDLEELRKALDARPEIADKLQAFMERHEGLVLGYLYERRKSEMVEAINVRVPGAVDGKRVGRSSPAVLLEEGP